MEVPKNFEAPGTYKFRRVLIGGMILAAKTKTLFSSTPEPVATRNVLHKVIGMKKKTVNPNINKEDRHINGVPVRIYTPASLNDIKTAPIIVYYHGGGFFLGNLDFYDDYLTELTIQLNAVAISVDYRMAPEHPFPIPTEDCYSVTKYILESGEEFGDTNKVIIAGDSAGGNIVAVMTQKLKKENIKLPRLQVLIYPWTQMFNNRLPSAIRYAKAAFTVGRATLWYLGVTNKNKVGSMISYNNHTLLIKDVNLKKKFKEYTDVSLIPEKYKDGLTYYDSYDMNHESIFPNQAYKPTVFNEEFSDEKLGELVKKLFTPDISPGLADPEMLKGLPEAYFIMSEMDPLKDEGLIYSERLRKEDVNVHVKYYESSYHGCAQMVDEKGYQVARDMLKDLIEYVKNNIIS